MSKSRENRCFVLEKTTKSDVRVGMLTTRQGVVSTPTFMPVGTRGAVKGLLPEQVGATGAQIVLGNTFHLHLQPGEETVRTLGDIHRFSGWQGPMLTDSGGFQVFSLAKIRKITEEGVEFKDPVTGDKRFISPEKSIDIQLELGSDIIMAFDDLTGLDDTARTRTTEAVERTHRWLKRCLDHFSLRTKDIPRNERPLFFGIVQGGLDKELRAQSLDFVQSLDVDGVAIGGLSVGESRAEMHDMLAYLHPMQDTSRPVYLMGVGHPIDLDFAFTHGIDMADCVLPTRNARHATAWIRGHKTIHLTNAEFIEDTGPIDETCDCYTCVSGFSRGFLRHQFKVKEPLAGSLVSIHNLRYLARLAEAHRNG